MKEDGLYVDWGQEENKLRKNFIYKRTKNTWLKMRYKKEAIIKHFHPCSSGQNDIHINNCQ